METPIKIQEKPADKFDANNKMLEEIRLLKARFLEIEQDIVFLNVSKTDVATQQKFAELIRELANRISVLENPDFIREAYESK